MSRAPILLALAALSLPLGACGFTPTNAGLIAL